MRRDHRERCDERGGRGEEIQVEFKRTVIQILPRRSKKLNTSQTEAFMTSSYTENQGQHLKYNEFTLNYERVVFIYLLIGMHRLWNQIILIITDKFSRSTADKHHPVCPHAYSGHRSWCKGVSPTAVCSFLHKKNYISIIHIYFQSSHTIMWGCLIWSSL